MTISLTFPFSRETAASLVHAGFGVEFIRSSHTEAARPSAVERFNDPMSRSQVSVTSLNLSLAGLDLHGACYHGVFTSFSWNLNMMNQAFGRLVRVGQTYPVSWKVLTVKGRIYDWVERICIGKWAEECRRVVRLGRPSTLYHWLCLICLHFRDYPQLPSSIFQPIALVCRRIQVI